MDRKTLLWDTLIYQQSHQYVNVIQLFQHFLSQVDFFQRLSVGWLEDIYLQRWYIRSLSIIPEKAWMARMFRARKEKTNLGISGSTSKEWNWLWSELGSESGARNEMREERGLFSDYLTGVLTHAERQSELNYCLKARQRQVVELWGSF